MLLSDDYNLHPADPTAIFVARLSFKGLEASPLLNICKDMTRQRGQDKNGKECIRLFISDMCQYWCNKATT